MNDSVMAIAPSNWAVETFTNYDDLELSSFELDLGLQDSIPEMFQDVSSLPTDLTPYSAAMDNVDLMTLAPVQTPDLCDISHSQASAISPFQDDSGSSVPSSTSSPVQFDSWAVQDTQPLSFVPQGYEQPQFYGTNFVNGRKRRACNEPGPPHPLPQGIMGPCVNFPGFPIKDMQPGSKPKRRRVQNARQRKAANVRERKRMFHLNEAFDSLKTKVPTFNYEKRLSRIETLRLAMTYISFMSELLSGKKPSDISLKPDGLNNSDSSFTLEDLENLKRTIASSYVSDGTESSESGSTSS